MFLLVPAHPGFPGQIPQSRKTVVCCVYVHQCNTVNFSALCFAVWKKCMEYEVEDSRPRGRPKRTWKEVVQEDYPSHILNREDAMDHSGWRKLVKDG